MMEKVLLHISDVSQEASSLLGYNTIQSGK
jgi:hypothetical protein